MRAKSDGVRTPHPQRLSWQKTSLFKQGGGSVSWLYILLLCSAGKGGGGGNVVGLGGCWGVGRRLVKEEIRGRRSRNGPKTPPPRGCRCSPLLSQSLLLIAITCVRPSKGLSLSPSLLHTSSGISFSSFLFVCFPIFSSCPSQLLAYSSRPKIFLHVSRRGSVHASHCVVGRMK